jgi:hypothetical protein
MAAEYVYLMGVTYGLKLAKCPKMNQSKAFLS